MELKTVKEAMDKWLPEFKRNDMVTRIIEEVFAQNARGLEITQRDRMIIPGKTMDYFEDLYYDMIPESNNKIIERCSYETSRESSRNFTKESIEIKANQGNPEVAYNYLEVIRTTEGYLLNTTSADLDQLVATNEIVCKKIKMGTWAYSRQQDKEIESYIEKTFEKRHTNIDKNYYDSLKQLYEENPNLKAENEIELNLVGIHPISILEDPTAFLFKKEEPAAGFASEFSYHNLLNIYMIENNKGKEDSITLEQTPYFKETLKQVDSLLKQTIDQEALDIILGIHLDKKDWNYFSPSDFMKDQTNFQKRK